MPPHAPAISTPRKRSHTEHLIISCFFSFFLLGILLFTEILSQWNLIPAVLAASAQNPNPTLAAPGWLQSTSGVKPKDLGVYVKGKQDTKVIPIVHPSTITMEPVTFIVTPQAQHFISADTHLEVDIPADTVSAQQVKAAGGVIHLKVIQREGGSGGSASGHLIFGSYQFQWTDATGKALTTLVLAQPLKIGYHLLAQQASLIRKNQAITAVWLNDTSMPSTPTTTQTAVQTTGKTAAAPTPTSTVLATQADPSGLAWSVSSLLNQSGSTTSMTSPKTTTTTTSPKTTAIAAVSSSTITFNTTAPEASWGTPTDFQTGLNSGALSYTYPLSVPPGPGGLAPSLSLNYSSGSVNETHNAQANSSWVGAGWNLDLGSISWGQENVTPGGTNRLENVWNINDPSGLSGQLIPPDLNASTSAPTIPSMSSLPAQYLWHTAPESHARVQEINFNGSPCWHVWLPNGTIEEFGCTDQSRQTAQDASGNSNPYRWNLNLIVDRNGNQIRVNYQRITLSTGVRDAVISSVEYDDPACHNSAFNGATAACSSWNPQVRIVFDATTQVASLTNGGIPGNCSDWTNSTSARCDNPIDLTGSSGLGIAKSMNTYVLNDVQIQVKSNLLRKYVLFYEQTHSYAVTDPLSGLQESVAGALDLTRIQQQGTNGTTLNAPVVNIAYQNHVERYEDLSHHALPSSNCGTSWAPRDGAGCYLWEQTYSTNYISTLDNGRGWHENFSWQEAHANTHGVDSGAINDVFTCNGQQSATNLCSQADDGAWSRIVVQSRQSVTNGVTSTWNYRYYLRQGWPAPPCTNCLQGYTWGNINDNDYADYYNTIFTSFASAQVTNPDGSSQIETFYSSDGIGLASSSITCYSSAGCHPAPYSNPNPVLAGQAQQVQNYGIDGKLLAVNNITYATNCPPPGVGHSGNASGAPNDIGDSQLSSELDTNNPVVVCDPRTTQEDSYQVEGVTDINGYLNDARVIHQQTNITYDSDNQGANATSGYDYGNVSRMDVTGNDVNNQHFISGTTYYPNDNIGSGVYLTNLPAQGVTLDANGNSYNCTASIYGSNTAVNQAPSALQRTTTINYLTNGSCSGSAITISNTYDVSGNSMSEIDADNHLGCALGANTYSGCMNYDASATHVLSVTNAKNHQLSFVYDPGAAGGFGQWTTSATNVNGQTSSFQYDALGRTIAVFLPGDNASSPTTTYTYINTCTVGQTRPCIETDTRTRINNGGNTTITKAYYNGIGKLVETIEPGTTPFSKIPAISSLIVTYTVYDAMGRATTSSLPYAVANSSGTPGGNGYITPDLTQARSVTHYDGLGRSLGMVTYSNTSTITLSTSMAYSVTQGVPNINVDTTTPFTMVTTTDAYQHQSVAYLDALIRPRYSQNYNGTGTATKPYTVLKTIQNNYDAVGNVISTLTFDAASHQQAYQSKAYDGLNRLRGWNDADLGSCTASPLPPGCSSTADTAWKKTYDANSNVISETDPRGITTYISYDNLDRPLCTGSTSAVVNPCQNSATSLFFYDTYDQNSNPTATFPSGCAADNALPAYSVGKLIAEIFNGSVGSGWRCASYDNREQSVANTLSVTADSRTTTQTVSVGYNNGGEITSLTYPDGEILAQTYDDNGNFRGSSTANGAITSTVQYTKAGQLASMTLGGIIVSGTATTPVQTSMTYDGIQRISSSSASVNSHAVFSQTRTYDNVSNVLSIQTTLPTTSGGTKTDSQSFCYDEHNRLVWAGNTGVPTGGDHCGLNPTGTTVASYQQPLSYDALDRLINGPSGTHSYNASEPHALTNLGSIPKPYAAYDAMGNMTCRNIDTTTGHSCDAAKTGAIMTYDHEGRLVNWQAPQGTTASDQFLYDGSGNRVLERSSTTTGGTTTVSSTITFDGLTDVTITGGTTSTIKYYSAGNQTVAMNKDGTFYYLLNDLLGSTTVVLKSNGTTQAALLGSPYGSTRYSDGIIPTAYNFTGQRLDSQTGLLYYNSRYYDPVSGRFVRADTIINNAQGMDPYAYVSGNPETDTDPTGHCTACAIAAEVAGTLGIELGPADIILIGAAYVLTYLIIHQISSSPVATGTYTASTSGSTADGIDGSNNSDISSLKHAERNYLQQQAAAIAAAAAAAAAAASANSGGVTFPGDTSTSGPITYQTTKARIFGERDKGKAGQGKTSGPINEIKSEGLNTTTKVKDFNKDTGLDIENLKKYNGKCAEVGLCKKIGPISEWITKVALLNVTRIVMEIEGAPGNGRPCEDCQVIVDQIAELVRNTETKSGEKLEFVLRFFK